MASHTGKISFYCEALEVSRQAFYDYLDRKNKPWKYQNLADAMMKIHADDECNEDYGRVRMYQALAYRQEIGELTDVHVVILPSSVRIAIYFSLCSFPTSDGSLRKKRRHPLRIHSFLPNDDWKLFFYTLCHLSIVT